MTNVLKKLYEGTFCFLLLCVQWTATNFTEDNDKIINLQNNVPPAKLGEFCWDEICQENLFCNEEFICQCRPGFQIYNNECVIIAGNNEPCEKSEDCCGELLCINGFCRKVVPNSEFITLAKICLGITVTTIVIAVFCSLIKCLYRYDSSRAFRRDNPSLNSILPIGHRSEEYLSKYLSETFCKHCFERHLMIGKFRRQPLHPGPLQCEVLDEKPPSYEDCIRSTGGNPLVEPPPYTISTNNNVTSTTETGLRFTNMYAVNAQNLTPLSVQSLNHDVNSNAVVTESFEKNNPRASVKLP